MKIWHLDQHDENRLLAEGSADPNPMAEGQYLIPAHAAIVPPLPDAGGKTVHYDAVSCAWYYRDIPPAPDMPAEPTAAELRRSAILLEMADIDRKSVRPLREGTAGKPRLADLETEAKALRAEMAAMV